MSVTTADSIATINNFFDEVPPISEELFTEVSNQLKRKIMAYLPDIPIDPIRAIDLYANSIDGIKRIHNAHLIPFLN